MAPVKPVQRPITPDSVKALMIIEALIAGFLGFWLYSEYLHNIYFQAYFNTVFLQNMTTYTAPTGVAIGLTGLGAAAALWRNLRRAKLRMETLTTLKVRAPVEKVLLSMPLPDEQTTPMPSATSANPLEPLIQPVQIGLTDQQKK